MVEPGLTLLDSPAAAELGRAFAWRSEFPAVFGRANPGFDGVLGNPPYVRQESLKAFKTYFSSEYESFSSTGDLFVYFIERGVRLLRRNGRLGVITSSSLLRASFATALRAYLGRTARVEKIIDFGGFPVFEGAKDTYVCIPILTVGGTETGDAAVKAAVIDSGLPGDIAALVEAKSFSVARSRLTEHAWPIRRQSEFEMLDRILLDSMPLAGLVGGRLYYGIKSGLTKAFVVEAEVGKRLAAGGGLASGLVHPWFGGEHVRSFGIKESSGTMIAVPCGWTRETLFTNAKDAPSERDAWVAFRKAVPAIATQLEGFAAEARERDDQGDYWWELRPCDYYHILKGNKIAFPDIANGPRFALDRTGGYPGNTVYCFPSASYRLLGYLNSSVAWFTISMTAIPFGYRAGSYRYRLFDQYMARLPVPGPIAGAKDGSTTVARIEKLAKGLEQLQSQVSGGGRSSGMRELLRQLDEAVCDALQLTAPERAVIAGAAVVQTED